MQPPDRAAPLQEQRISALAAQHADVLTRLTASTRRGPTQGAVGDGRRRHETFLIAARRSARRAGASKGAIHTVAVTVSRREQQLQRGREAGLRSRLPP
jgi:hypothetical protein